MSKNTPQSDKEAKEQSLDQENALSYLVISAALEVHKTLGGPGLLESAYEEALCFELQSRGLKVDRQKRLPIIYKGHTLGTPLVLDLLVNNLLIIECKATTQYNDIFETQTRTYLRLTNLKLGLVINFGERLLKNGIHRVINSL